MTSRKSTAQLNLWSPQRLRIATLVEDKRFDLAIGAVILANSIVLVIETDQRAKCQDMNGDACNEEEFVYSIIGSCFLVIYGLELVLKFFAYRLHFFQSTWNNFDFTIVTLSVLSEVLGGMIPAISVARVFRAARLAKVFRVLMVYKELYMIIFGFASAMRAILWASLLLFFLLTIWSIFAVELLHPVNRELAIQGSPAYEGCDRCSRAFESVMASNLTFLQTTLTGDNWGQYALPIIEKHPHLAVLFIGVWSTVVLGFGNLILAVIVDCAAEARQDDLTYQERVKMLGEEAAMQQFLKLCREIDGSGSGHLSYEQFLQVYNNSAELSQMLKVMNIEETELPMLFAIMDEDGSGDISYQEFANSMHKMRASEAYLNFTFIKHEIKEVKELAEEEFKKVHTEISSLSDLVRGICTNGMQHISLFDPAKGKTENHQADNGPLKDTMPMKVGGADSVVDMLFQHPIMLKLDEIVAAVAPAKTTPESDPDNRSAVKDPISASIGRADVLVDKLFQQQVILKLDQIVASVEHVVLKTIHSPAALIGAEFEVRPSQLQNLPRVPEIIRDSSGSVALPHQHSPDNPRTQKSNSPVNLPKLPLHNLIDTEVDWSLLANCTREAFEGSAAASNAREACGHSDVNAIRR